MYHNQTGYINNYIVLYNIIKHNFSFLFCFLCFYYLYFFYIRSVTKRYLKIYIFKVLNYCILSNIKHNERIIAPFNYYVL